jgi:hypothetical protein
MIYMAPTSPWCRSGVTVVVITKGAGIKESRIMAKKSGERKKTECPISRRMFHNKGGAVNAELKLVGGPSTTVHLPQKDFSSGAFGYFNNEKVTLVINGIPVKFQANIQLVAVGSKDLGPDREVEVVDAEDDAEEE